MTQKETLAQIRALGMAGRYSADWKEWRVTLRAEDEPDAERREAIAYYTHDAEDALHTAPPCARPLPSNASLPEEHPRHDERATNQDEGAGRGGP